MNDATRNWFDQGGQAYSTFRPHYPAQLSEFLAGIAPNTTQAVDVGCGNGQLTRQLAEHFTSVSGFDSSAQQLEHVEAAENISYQTAPAEDLPLLSRSTSLITAAQAAHWFDLPAFYREVRRVAEPGAVLALISYGVLELEEPLGERFRRFYWEEIGPYWPVERKLVDSGYATLDFPFAVIAAPVMEIRLEWSLDEFLGYVGTWSAVRKAREAGREELLQAFARDLAELWEGRMTVRWPINMRLGRV